jgi:hypothetical protein
MWYWGLGSPFWLMHGDSLFESGLFMEGSGTSAFPTLYYRDSVNLALDQNAQFARTIPAALKDSLGVWMSNTRWGNFMGAERWRESMVLDLGRGTRIFPNIWGNLYELTDDDAEFLGWITRFAKKNASCFRDRKVILGDPFRNDVYGYAHGRGSRGFVFVNNAQFVSRRATLRLDASLGLDARTGTPVGIVSHFPERRRLRRPDRRGFALGDTLELWLRPFETLMLEVAPAAKTARLPVRSISDGQAADLGTALVLRPAMLDEGMDVGFLDREVFAQRKFEKKVYAFESAFPALDGDQPILAIAVCLRKGAEPWKYAPTVVQIVQALVRVGGRNVQLIPVPEGRQHGSTQSHGCSWVIWKVRLSPQWSREPFKIAVHANLPADVEARMEAWVVKRWWRENTRPTGDGYYTYTAS